MKYKKSFYNILTNVPNKENYIIFNSVTTALGVLDKATYSLYQSINMLSLSDVENKDIASINAMIENGFLVDYNLNEHTNLVIENRKAQYNTDGNRLLVILPTMNCNMKCSYCFEHYNEGTKMNKETQEDLIKFIKIFIKDANSLHIKWCGGEPLVAKDVIMNVSDKVISICKNQNIKYTSSIVTNGSLLTKNLAIELRNKCNIDLAQITIDGIEKSHNDRRRFKDSNKSSFKVITDNIEDIKDILKINIRINVDRNNIDEMEQLIKYFINERNWLNCEDIMFYFAPVLQDRKGCNVCMESCIETEELKELYINIKELVEKNIGVNIFSKFYFNRKAIACGASSMNYYVIDSIGDMYKCLFVVSNKEYCVGNIKDGYVINEIHSKYLLNNFEKICIDCKVKPICQGGCTQKRILNINNCPIYFKDCFDDIIKAKYYELIR